MLERRERGIPGEISIDPPVQAPRLQHNGPIDPETVAVPLEEFLRKDFHIAGGPDEAPLHRRRDLNDARARDGGIREREKVEVPIFGWEFDRISPAEDGCVDD